MKRLLIILLLANLMWACNNYQHSENKEALNSTKANQDQNETSTEKLVLNNGVKWKADSTTNSNVKSLLAIIEAFDTGTGKSVGAYKKVADDLQQGLNKMINECKMKGPDHEALHKWLEPLLGDEAKLKQVSTEADAAKLFEAIHAHVNLYKQYFQ